MKPKVLAFTINHEKSFLKKLALWKKNYNELQKQGSALA